MKKSILLLVALLISGVGSVFAQSTDKSRPTPLTSNELNGKLGGRDGEYYYSFLAGRGEVTITVEVNSAGHSTGLTFDLEDNADHRLIASTRVQADGGTAKKTARVDLSTRQTVVLHLTQSVLDGAGSYRLRIGGAVASGGTETVRPSTVSTTQSTQPSSNAARFNGTGRARATPRFDLPALQSIVRQRRSKPAAVGNAAKQQLFDGKVPTVYAILAPGQMTVPDKAQIMTVYSTIANYQDVQSSFISFQSAGMAIPPTLFLAVNNTTAGANYLIDLSVATDCEVVSDCGVGQYTVGQGDSEQIVVANNGHLFIHLDQPDAGWHSFYIRNKGWRFYSCEITRLD